MKRIFSPISKPRYILIRVLTDKGEWFEIGVSEIDHIKDAIQD